MIMLMMTENVRCDSTICRRMEGRGILRLLSTKVFSSDRIYLDLVLLLLLTKFAEFISALSADKRLVRSYDVGDFLLDFFSLVLREKPSQYNKDMLYKNDRIRRILNLCIRVSECITHTCCKSKLYNIVQQ